MDQRRPTLPAPEHDGAERPPSEPEWIVAREGRIRLLCVARFDAALRAAGLTDPDRLLALVGSLQPDATRGAGRASTHVVETSEGPVFLKRALKGGVLAPLFFGRVPRFERAANEIEVTARLRERGAPVLEPVVAAGLRDALGWRAVIGTVAVAYATDGASALAHALEADHGRSESGVAPLLCRRFGSAIRAFHDAGGRHADLAVTNLLHDPHNDRVSVVDLQGGRAGAAPAARRRRRELLRLRRSIERRPAIRPVLAAGWPELIRGYCEPAAPWTEALGSSLAER